MTKYRVGVIGCGRYDVTARPFVDGRRDKRFGIAYCHGNAYRDFDQTEIVAASSRDPGRLSAFGDYFGVLHRYPDWREMLARESLDIVSVCTWPQVQPEIVTAVAAAGVRAILADKPMGLSMAACADMVDVCRARGTVLAVDHQRRLGGPFRAAKRIVDSGAIGRILRVEAYVGGSNLLAWGTHWADIIAFYVDESPARWVAAQVETGEGGMTLWGQEADHRAVVHIGFANGAQGYIELGLPGWPAAVAQAAGSLEIGLPGFGGAVNRIIGADGVVEVLELDPAEPTTGAVRAHARDTKGWVLERTADSIHDLSHYTRAVEDLCRALEAGRAPELSGDRGLAAHEVVFAAYESALKGERVTLPIARTGDCPLDRLVAARPHKGASSRGNPVFV